MTDTAYRRDFSVTIHIGHLNVPSAAQRRSGRPTDGERQAQRLIDALSGAPQLIDPSHPPTLSSAGSTLSFKIHSGAYASFKEADIKRIYRQVMGRELVFAANPQGGPTSRSGNGRSGDGRGGWIGDVIDGVGDFFGSLGD